MQQSRLKDKVAPVPKYYTMTVMADRGTLHGQSRGILRGPWSGGLWLWLRLKLCKEQMRRDDKRPSSGLRAWGKCNTINTVICKYIGDTETKLPTFHGSCYKHIIPEGVPTVLKLLTLTYLILLYQSL
jgi:hypothetical protein